MNNKKYPGLGAGSPQIPFALLQPGNPIGIKRVSIQTKNAKVGNFEFVIRSEYDVKNYEAMMMVLYADFIESYLHKMRGKQVSESFFKEKVEDQNATHRCIISLKRVIKKLGGDLNRTAFRIHSDNQSAILFIDKDLPETEGDDKHYICIMILTNAANKYSETYAIDIDLNAPEPNAVHNMLSTVFILSDNFHVRKNAVKKFADPIVMIGRLDDRAAYYLDELLHGILNSPDQSYEEWESPVYNDAELYLYKNIIKKINPVCTSHAFASFAVIEDMKNSFSQFDGKIPACLNPSTDCKDVPFIDLGPKEHQFIFNYCDRNNKFGNGLFVDIRPYFESPRYGDTIRIRANETVESTFELLVWYTMNKEQDLIRFHLCHRVNETMTVAVILDYVNMSNFNVVHSLRSVRYDVIYSTPDMLCPSVEAIKDKSPLAASSYTDVLLVLDQIIRIFIAIHDRPERTKMIKCTEKRMERDPKRPKAPAVEKEYVVSRILKPVKEAKEYIERMRTSGTRNVEYTMEEWERVGHLRRTRSGKQIWIEATTCRRHLPLSEKEVHIKL